MDGPTSRLPSTVTNPDLSLAHAVAARRSLRELYSSAPVTPSLYIDPPRPPKEGHEWVWFPGGYWAEREVVETPSKEFVKVFKWRKRSGKGSSSRETTTINHLQDSLEQAPSDTYEQQASRMPLLTPFLSEEAHVQSLQRPSMPRHGNSSDSASSLWLNRIPRPPLPSPFLTEEAHVQSLQRPPTIYQDSLSNDSGSSMFKLTRTLPSSPLTHSKQNLDRVTPMTGSTDEPSEATTTEPTTPTGDGQLKPKRSLINRLLSPEAKPPKPKKPSPTESGGNSDSYMTATTAKAVAPPPPPLPTSHSTPMGRVAALLRDESRRSHKTRSMRIFSKSSWHRKTSAGSETSVSSSVRDMLRGKTPTVSPEPDEGVCFEPCNSWSAQYPGGSKLYSINILSHPMTPYCSRASNPARFNVPIYASSKATASQAHTIYTQEATRVKTPPLRQGVADQRPRSFFFDISSPPPPPPLDQDRLPAQTATTSDGGGNESSHSHTPSRHQHTHQHDEEAKKQQQQQKQPRTTTDTRKARTTKSSSSAASASVSSSVPADTIKPKSRKRTTKPKTKTKKKTTTESCKEWWEVPAPVPPSHPLYAHLSPSSYAAMAAAATFEFDVPEHLPSSPMCPTNKRHRSGGTGVCVYHGRRKRSGGGGGGGGGHGGSGGGGGGGVVEEGEGEGSVRSDVEDKYDDTEDDFWT
ncbi:hypothetical protein F5X96DRAFT_694542 [Biscogniauxia mediterranea]|nr:hypothetical protein F5X96DRAFT_694542 [Biscogniauxia mediterranea]